MDIYSKATDSKRYVPFMANYSRHCLTNIPFSLARTTCIIVENENVKEKWFKELKTTLLEQKYLKSQIEASILRAKEIPLKFLRQSKATKNEEIIRFAITYYLNNPKVFSVIKQSFHKFQYPNLTSNIFERKKLVKSVRQAINLGMLLCRSKFESQHKNQEVKNYGKNSVSCPYVLKALLYQFKRANKRFLLRNSFKCEKSNSIYVVIGLGFKEKYIGEIGCLVKDTRLLFS